MMNKTAKQDDDCVSRFVDDGGENAYSTLYRHLVGGVTQMFRSARDQHKSEPKTAALSLAGSYGLARAPQRLFRSNDSIRRVSEQEKLATIVGGPNASELERAFAQIAETYITDKAPLLTNYMLGFQLLKKTDDDTKACGIFAYKVGDELVYIPVFTINGDIQGHELMYVVSRDQFVPSDEKWVNFLLSRKPLEPGRIERRERSDIPSQGNFRPTMMTSGLKLSSYTGLPVLAPELTLDALRTLFKQASVGTPLLERSFWRDMREPYHKNIPTLYWKEAAAIDLDVRRLFQQSYKATKLAAAWCHDYPIVQKLFRYAMDGEPLDSYLTDWEKRAELAGKLNVRLSAPKSLRQKLLEKTASQKKPVGPEEKIAVYDLEEIPDHLFRFMPTKLVDKIHQDGYYVVDTRPESKLASIITTEERGLFNPVGPGLYQVFMANGKFRDCFVLFSDDPTERQHDESEWIVLDKETSAYRRKSLSEIWTSSRESAPNWLDQLPKSTGTLSTHAENEWQRHDGIDSYLITPSGHAWRGRFLETAKNSYYDESSDCEISLTSTSLKGFKQICSNRDEDGYRISQAPIIGPKETQLRRYKDEGNNLTLGGRQLWLAMLMEGTLPVTIQKQQRAFGEYAIDGKPPRSKSAALATLMREHHLSHATAEYVLERADRDYPGCTEFLREKIAFSGPISQDRYSVMFPKKEQDEHEITGLTVEQDLNTEEPVESLRPTKEPDDKEMWPGLWDSETNSSMNGSPNPPAPNQSDINLASQAAQAGQKDFVSSQMLLALLREIDSDDIIPKYISTFEKACDSLGRLYMQLLWRTDTFEDRFGETQLTEFKEMLVALFQQIGDFICYLRQRDVRPAPVLSLGTVNIEKGP